MRGFTSAYPSGDNGLAVITMAKGDMEMWVLLIIALASPGAPGGGVHSSMTTLQFQTQAVCENAAKTVDQMNVRSAASSLAVTSSCIQQK